VLRQQTSTTHAIPPASNTPAVLAAAMYIRLYNSSNVLTYCPCWRQPVLAHALHLALLIGQHCHTLAKAITATLRSVAESHYDPRPLLNCNCGGSCTEPCAPWPCCPYFKATAVRPSLQQHPHRPPLAPMTCCCNNSGPNPVALTRQPSGRGTLKLLFRLELSYNVPHEAAS
jgi:hypothetical protein